MPRGKDDSGTADCDECYNRKGRNAKIQHQLEMSERTLREHLHQLYGKAGEADGFISSRLVWHRFVWSQFGQRAKDEHKSIWQAYYDSHRESEVLPEKFKDGTTRQTREYLTRIWRIQDAKGLPSFNNPDWYKPND